MCKIPSHIHLVFKKRPSSDIERDRSTKKKTEQKKRKKKTSQPPLSHMKPGLILNILSRVEIFLSLNRKTID